MARHFTLAWDVTLPNGRRYRRGAVEVPDGEGDLLARAKGVAELKSAPVAEPDAPEPDAPEEDAGAAAAKLKADHSKATLLAVAEDLTIEGTDRMNKSELAAAIVEVREEGE